MENRIEILFSVISLFEEQLKENNCKMSRFAASNEFDCARICAEYFTDGCKEEFDIHYHPLRKSAEISLR